MSIAEFTLVNKIPLTILRHSQGSYVDGDWVEGTEQQIVIKGNYHPFSDYQVMMLPESDRTRSWMWLFTADLVRSKREGVGGWDADRVVLDGDLYEAMASQKFSMKVRDHYEIKLARVERTPDTPSI